MVTREADGRIRVVGRITGLGIEPQHIRWLAAAPVTRGIGFAGSGLPYPNREIALDDTPHRGELASPDGSFSLLLNGIPAGYYSGLGSVYVPPLIEFFSTTRDGKRLHAALWINDTAAPYRWISGAPAPLRPAAPDEESMGRAMYYSGREAIPLFDSQEALLRARGYPAEQTQRGWPAAVDATPWKHTPSP